MLHLRTATDPAWVDAVLADFDSFLLDHAAAERKASAMAMTFVVRYPDRHAIHEPMIVMAREELTHFHRVFRLCKERGLRFVGDQKDAYVNRLMRCIQRGRDGEFLDRLVMAGVVEARGCERFGCVAAALPAGPLKAFYDEITRSESRHADLFIELAAEYFPADVIAERVDVFLSADAEICATLPVRAALH
jgi:tRNA 2-(methylsulfanyl)-N6-isopentenyladenosine37 hydroxylase